MFWIVQTQLTILVNFVIYFLTNELFLLFCGLLLIHFFDNLQLYKFFQEKERERSKKKLNQY